VTTLKREGRSSLLLTSIRTTAVTSNSTMTRSHSLVALQIALVLSSAAAFSSLTNSHVVLPRALQMSSQYGEFAQQDNTMNSLRDALQKLEMQKSEVPPHQVNNNNVDPIMPVQDKDGIYEIMSKEQHA